MSAPAVITRDIAAAWRSQRGAAITLAVGVLALGLLFHEDWSPRSIRGSPPRPTTIASW